MKFKKYQLKNGLRIILSPIKDCQSVTALALIGTGSRYEKQENNGISHFLEHMFFKGTKNRPRPQDVVEDLDLIGGEYNAFTSHEYTGFWAKVAAPHLDLTLDWLSDILLNSKFSQQEMEKEKNVIVEEINLYQDSPMKKIYFNWLHLLYGQQSLGMPILGPKKNVENANRKMLLDYFQKQYQAKNTVICLSGKVSDSPSLIKKIEKYFANISNGDPASAQLIDDQQGNSSISVEYKKTDQSHLIIGFRGIGMNNPNRYVLQLISTILGGYMSSRLFVEVREKRGLAYYIKSAADFFTDTGSIVAQAGVANQKIQESIRVILQEFKKIQEGKISQKELNKAKENLIGRLALSLETSDDVATWLAEQEVLKNKILTPKQLSQKISKITLTDVKKMSREIFSPNRLNLAIIGPFKEKKPFEKLLEKY
ncbi:MAG TPA: insulinase family protein [Candidatus Portnoybacteria bacterium]|nr:insulinase family protein [Candidatus Portnoybacteria bacterium]